MTDKRSQRLGLACLAVCGVLAFVGQGCSDEAFASFRRPVGRGSPAFSKIAAAGAVQNSLDDAYSGWLARWDGANYSSSTFNDLTGTLDAPKQTAADASCGQSTSGLTTSAIGSARENQACTIQDGTTGAHGENSSANAFNISDATDVHVRFLFKLETGGAATVGVLLDLLNGSSNRLELRIQGDDDVYLDLHGGSTSGTANTMSGILTQGAWNLLDVIIPDDGLGSTIKFCVNGTCTDGGTTTAADYTGYTWGSSVNFGLLGFNSGTVPDDIDFVFSGIRTGEMTEALHDADVTALGL